MYNYKYYKYKTMVLNLWCPGKSKTKSFYLKAYKTSPQYKYSPLYLRWVEIRNMNETPDMVHHFKSTIHHNQLEYSHTEIVPNLKDDTNYYVRYTDNNTHNVFDIYIPIDEYVDIFYKD